MSILIKTKRWTSSSTRQGIKEEILNSTWENLSPKLPEKTIHPGAHQWVFWLSCIRQPLPDKASTLDISRASKYRMEVENVDGNLKQRIGFYGNGLWITKQADTCGWFFWSLWSLFGVIGKIFIEFSKQGPAPNHWNLIESAIFQSKGPLWSLGMKTSILRYLKRFTRQWLTSWQQLWE